jgi:hypothetical protein
MDKKSNMESYVAELRLTIPDEIIKQISDKLGGNQKASDIARDAITLFNWAVDERAKGRLVLSTGEKGEDVARLTMPSLEGAAAKGAAQNK